MEDSLPDATVTLWKRVPKETPGANEGLLALAPGTLDFSKPLFLCLSGNAARSPEEANGFAKMAERLLGGGHVHDSGAQLISTQYEMPLEPPMPVTKLNNAQYKKDRRLVAEQFSADIARKLFGGNDVIPELHGLDARSRKAALDRCQAALGNVNILAYSFGTYLANFIHERVRNLMEQRGFTPEEGAQARRCIHVVCFGETGIWQDNARDLSSLNGVPRIPWDFTSVHLTSSRDHTMQQMSGITSYAMQEAGHRDRIFIFGEKKNVLLLIGCLPEKILSVDSAGNLISRNSDEARITAPAYQGHNIRGYSGMLDKSPYVSEEGGQWFLPSALQTALRNCFFTSLHGGRANAAALLEGGSHLKPDNAGASVTRSHEMFLPAHESYGFKKRIGRLMEQSVHSPRLPANEPEAWTELLHRKPARRLGAGEAGYGARS